MPRDGEIEIHREYPKAAPIEFAMASQDHMQDRYCV
jgi:hypothetical protein